MRIQKCQSVQKKRKWKQIDRQTDGRTDTFDCFTFAANAFGNYLKLKWSIYVVLLVPLKI